VRPGQGTKEGEATAAAVCAEIKRDAALNLQPLQLRVQGKERFLRLR
jgi:hypothetical protein